MFTNDIQTLQLNKYEIEKLKRLSNTTYNLVITGTVGVGKSTICEILYNTLNPILNVKSYPEFINVKYNDINVGTQMFEMKVNNVISAFTFQSYILDIWDYLLKQNCYNQSNINCNFNIFERLPEDSVRCFAKLSLENKDMTKYEYDNLIHKHKYLVSKYRLLGYNAFKAVNVENDRLYATCHKIIKRIIDDYDSKIKNRVIYLTVTDEKIYKQRILNRSRTGEDSYNRRILNQFKSFYSTQFKGVKSVDKPKSNNVDESNNSNETKQTKKYYDDLDNTNEVKQNKFSEPGSSAKRYYRTRRHRRTNTTVTPTDETKAIDNESIPKIIIEEVEDNVVESNDVVNETKPNTTVESNESIKDQIINDTTVVTETNIVEPIETIESNESNSNNVTIESNKPIESIESNDIVNEVESDNEIDLSNLDLE